MGCTSSRNLPNEQGHILKHKEVSRTPDRVHGKSKTPVIGVGRPVGGSSPQLDKRSAQLAAAEQRATKEASRGLNSGAKGVDLNESQKKQELIGKIQAAYQVRISPY